MHYVRQYQVYDMHTFMYKTCTKCTKPVAIHSTVLGSRTAALIYK